MNIGAVIMLCFASLLAGILIGCWKEGKAVAKMADDLSAMHYKEIRLVIDKILEFRKNEQGGER